MRNLIALVFATGLALGTAQAGDFELTATTGYRSGGSIRVVEQAFQHRSMAVGITGAGTFGLRLGIPVAKRLHLELLASRQGTSLEDTQGLFGELPGGFLEPRERNFIDIDVSYYQGGVTYELGDSWSRGYVAVAAGVVDIDPSFPLPGDTVVAASAGCGVKFDLSEHLGLRIEGRFFWADTDQDVSAVQAIEVPPEEGAPPERPDDCRGPCTYTYYYRPGFEQGELIAGLTYRF
jgi:hypothetical protein